MNVVNKCEERIGNFMGRSVTIIEQASSFDGAVAFGLCNGTMMII